MKIWENKCGDMVCELETHDLEGLNKPYALVRNEFHGGGVAEYYKSLQKAEAHTRCGGGCRCGGCGVMFDASELPDYEDPQTGVTPEECTWIMLPESGVMLPVLD